MVGDSKTEEHLYVKKSTDEKSIWSNKTVRKRNKNSGCRKDFQMRRLWKVPQSNHQLASMSVSQRFPDASIIESATVC